MSEEEAKEAYDVGYGDGFDEGYRAAKAEEAANAIVASITKKAYVKLKDEAVERCVNEYREMLKAWRVPAWPCYMDPPLQPYLPPKGFTNWEFELAPADEKESA